MKKPKRIVNSMSGDYVSERFHIYIESIKRFYETKDTLLYAVKGWGFDCTGKAGKLIFDFGGEVLDKQESYEARPDLIKIFAKEGITVSGKPGFHCFYQIKKTDENKKLTIRYSSELNEAEETVLEITDIKTESSYLCHIEDDISWSDTSIMVRGWMIQNPESIFGKKKKAEFPVSVTDNKNSHITYTLVNEARPDIVKRFRLTDETECFGFELTWDYDVNALYCIHMGTDTDFVEESIDIQKLFFEARESKRRYRNFFHMLKNQDVNRKEDDRKYIQTYGFGEYQKLLKKRFEPLDPEYQRYFEKHRASKGDLKKQAEEKLIGPMISVVVPTYNTPIDYLHNMIDSVCNQSYSNWQLCIADGSEGNKELEDILEDYHRKDSRIVYSICEKNGGISINTNAALKLVKGDYVALLDHDDILAPEALYEVVKVINAHEDADVVYTDEDKFINDLKDHYQPAFKPDFNPDFLRSCNYITHLFVVRKSIVDAIGEFDPNCDGSQDFDFILRCTERAKNVYHIPKILYYWRCHPGSVALNPESKTYAYDAAIRAVKEHLKRRGVSYESVHSIPNTLGIYRTNYTLTPKKVTIVILGDKNSFTDKSIKEKSSYSDYEILYSGKNAKMLNETVHSASGEYILFLDSDMEVVSEDFVEKMLSECERSDVGVVGGKIFYDDDTIYHAGVVFGYHNLCGRLLAGRHAVEMGKYANAILQQNTSAVLSSCMMVEKIFFESLGGFDEMFSGAFFDVDFCIRTKENGYLITFEPDAIFVTHKGKYPGCDIVDEKYVGYEEDVSYAKEKWSDVLKKRDPFYNPNLSLKRLSYDVRYHA